MNKSQNKPVVELFVKQSNYNPDEKGCCPFCQKWFMLLYLMVEKDLLSLRLTPVNLNVPAIDYTNLNVGRKLPVVVIHELRNKVEKNKVPLIMADSDEAIENLLITWNLDNSLISSTSINIPGNLLRNFNRYLRTGLERGLEVDLCTLERHLAQHGNRFIEGESPSYSDCAMGPKLHQIRIACSYYRDYIIPHDFVYIWTYFANLYQLEAFRISCPADKDILVHYLDRVYPRDSANGMSILNEINAMSDEDKTFTVPSAIKPISLGPYSSTKVSYSDEEHDGPRNYHLKRSSIFTKTSDYGSLNSTNEFYNDASDVSL